MNILTLRVSPLADLSNLKYLNLDSIQVNDLTPLMGLNKLKYLDVEGTLATDEEVRKLQTALPNCRVWH